MRKQDTGRKILGHKHIRGQRIGGAMKIASLNLSDSLFKRLFFLDMQLQHFVLSSNIRNVFISTGSAAMHCFNVISTTQNQISRVLILISSSFPFSFTFKGCGEAIAITTPRAQVSTSQNKLRQFLMTDFPPISIN